MNWQLLGTVGLKALEVLVATIQFALKDEDPEVAMAEFRKRIDEIALDLEGLKDRQAQRQRELDNAVPVS